MTAYKITDLTATTTLANVDLLVVVTDPVANPATKKITYSNFFANVVSNAKFSNTVTFANTVTFTNTVNFGSSTNAANGYTYLPNRFKLNWGWVSANSTDGNVIFSSAYTTNVYVVTATSNSAVATYHAAVISQNSTSASIRTANTTSTNVFWQAIGY
jgi:hypothetical protein